MMQIEKHQTMIETALKAAPVVPVMVIDDFHKAVPLAQALVRGGLPVLEITLRTVTALECIKAIIAEVKGAIVGAGTVLTPGQLAQCEKLGCAFAVSPGSTPALLKAAEQSPVPLLPGAVTASEVMNLLDHGYHFQKFFPAESSGGITALQSLAAPLPQVKFCPTGGITPTLAPAYLKLSNVIALGGSWMVPKSAVAAGDWATIEKLAREAAALKAV
jgi:2-dehydro-3-deoxyphosphogluconate aldolase / (4S)-4-hydroxy-2-oxoglutarate aldolase